MRSIPLDFNGYREDALEEDIEKIYKVIDQFAAAMKEKMEEKYWEGYAGWDDIKGVEKVITDRLIEHARRGKGQEVDIANFAMMLWNASR